MRKLKLQMQQTVVGYVAGPNGELDWMTFGDDAELFKVVNALTDSSDTILMGRKITEGFINYWKDVVKNQPESPEFSFVASLLKNNLIDELNLFVNPTAIGNGMKIFVDSTNLELVHAKACKCGELMLQYTTKH